jgi:hypothetical protein
MRALILLHRWLGVAFCLLFAMWFASGIVMHFVPFPEFSEADRFAGLLPVDLASVAHGPSDAIAASGKKGVERLRLIQRSDGPVYLIPAFSGIGAVHADDLSDAAVHSPQLALTIAIDYARLRRWDSAKAEVEGPIPYDQWTVSGKFDRYRPLYRVALNDGRSAELYVSVMTGEVVLATTHWQRAWNYFGSIAHWIYPVALRAHPRAWSKLVWGLSFFAFVGATAGAVVGTLRIRIERGRPVSPYRGLQAWHHGIGLCCMLFVLSWIFSGWLSMDDGRLFSSEKPSSADIAAISGAAAWDSPAVIVAEQWSAPLLEAEWFALGGQLYRRDRVGLDQQRLFPGGGGALPDRAFLQADEINDAVRQLSLSCSAAATVPVGDVYVPASVVPGAPVFRVMCGSTWIDVDGSNGVLLEELDASRRAYRWLFTGLHTLDFPGLTARPMLRVTLIVVLCGCGFFFSMTGMVIAWRRLLSCFRAAE